VDTPAVFVAKDDVTSDDIVALLPVYVETFSVETIELVAIRLETDKKPAPNVLADMDDAINVEANIVDARKLDVPKEDAFIDNAFTVDALMVETRIELARIVEATKVDVPIVLDIKLDVCICCVWIVIAVILDAIKEET
jgi:hypothetical protein